MPTPALDELALARAAIDAARDSLREALGFTSEAHQQVLNEVNIALGSLNLRLARVVVELETELARQKPPPK